MNSVSCCPLGKIRKLHFSMGYDREKFGVAVTLQTYIWMYLVLISDGTPATLTGSSVVSVSPSKCLDRTSTDKFLPHSSQFIVHHSSYHSTIRPFFHTGLWRWLVAGAGYECSVNATRVNNKITSFQLQSEYWILVCRRVKWMETVVFTCVLAFLHDLPLSFVCLLDPCGRVGIPSSPVMWVRYFGGVFCF
jgi:hypothetical protein